MKASYLIIATFLAAFLLVFSVPAGQHLLSVFCLLLISLFLLSKKDVNSGYLVLVFLGVFSLGKVLLYPLEEYLFPISSGFVQNLSVFSINLFLDLLLIFFLKNRMVFSLKITNGRKPEVLEKNYSEGPLYGLLIGWCLVDFLALLENIVRNLEHLGISEDFAKQFWHITFIYDYYEYAKGVLMALTIVVLYMGVIIRKRQSLSAA